MKNEIINAIDNVIYDGDLPSANLILSSIEILGNLEENEKIIISEKIIKWTAEHNTWQLYPQRNRTLICIVKALKLQNLTLKLLLEELINRNPYEEKMDSFWRYVEELFLCSHADSARLSNHLFKSLIEFIPDSTGPKDSKIIDSELDILIITQQFLGGPHAPTNDVINYVKALFSLGRNVEILITNEYIRLPEKAWHREGNFRSDLIGRFQLDIDETTILGIGLKQIQSIENIQKTINYYREKRPKLVISVGAYSIYSEALGKYAKLITIPFSTEFVYSKYSRLIVWFSGDASKIEEIRNEYEMENVNIVTEINYQYQTPKNEKKVIRSDLNVDPTQKIGVIVGNRLDFDLDKEFLDYLDILMRSHPITLIIVGAVKEGKRLELKARYESAIVFVENHPNLIDLYAAVDFFLNPKRLGGGTSAAYALAAGLLVFTLNYGDVSKVAIPECVFENYNDMCRISEILENDLKVSLYKNKSINKFKLLSDKKLMLEKLIALSEISDV